MGCTTTGRLRRGLLEQQTLALSHGPLAELHCDVDGAVPRANSMDRRAATIRGWQTGSGSNDRCCNRFAAPYHTLSLRRQPARRLEPSLVFAFAAHLKSRVPIVPDLM